MSYEITALTQYPYRAVTHLEVQFSDGYTIVGSGAMVGRNDVLTATHMVYNPDHGGWAKSIKVYPGADYNSVTGQLYAPYGYYYADRMNAWPTQTFSVPSNATMAASEVPYDVAVLSMSSAIGDQLGWFGLSVGYDTSQWAYEIGYPSGSTGMMLGQAWIIHDSYYQEYHAYASNGSDIMGPGSSGGPLYVLSNGSPYIIGVKSAGSSTTSQWADIGFVYSNLLNVISSNDKLIQVANESRFLGTTGNDRFTGTGSNDVFSSSGGNDIYDGLAGTDLLIYHGSRSQFTVSWTSNGFQVSNGGVDSLSNIERLRFTDGTLALDIGLGQTAGVAYRLYQAAFARTPDTAGIKYWVAQMDGGQSNEQVAYNFIVSTEFKVLYGSNTSHDQELTAFYKNVLGRAPDPSGFSYWKDLLDNNKITEAQVLINFAESNENITLVGMAIQNGIWLGA